MDPDETSRRVAHAEILVQRMICAVHATTSLVKIEVEIVHGRPIPTLVRAAHSATIVCVGSVGFKRYGNGHLGSTAAGVIDAGLSAVAVVRADGAVRNRSRGAIAVEMIASQLNAALLKTAIAEARARGAAIRVITCWQTGSNEGNPHGAGSSHLDYQARAHLPRLGAMEAALPRARHSRDQHEHWYGRLRGTTRRPIHSAGRRPSRRARRDRTPRGAGRQGGVTELGLFGAHNKALRTSLWRSYTCRRGAQDGLSVHGDRMGYDKNGTLAARGGCLVARPDQVRNIWSTSFWPSTANWTDSSAWLSRNWPKLPTLARTIDRIERLFCRPAMVCQRRVPAGEPKRNPIRDHPSGTRER